MLDSPPTRDGLCLVTIALFIRLRHDSKAGTDNRVDTETPGPW